MQFEKNGKKPDEDFSLLKVELEEEKKIEDTLKHQLLEKHILKKTRILIQI